MYPIQSSNSSSWLDVLSASSSSEILLPWPYSSFVLSSSCASSLGGQRAETAGLASFGQGDELDPGLSTSQHGIEQNERALEHHGRRAVPRDDSEGGQDAHEEERELHGEGLSVP